MSYVACGQRMINVNLQHGCQQSDGSDNKNQKYAQVPFNGSYCSDRTENMMLRKFSYARHFNLNLELGEDKFYLT